MSFRRQLILGAALFGMLAVPQFVQPIGADEVLVADRLTNRVMRYSADGTFQGVLVDDPIHLDEPNGMVLSPDGNSLYVSSRQNSAVVRYDYHGTTATNPTVLIDSGISVPAGLLMDESSETLYVANLGEAADGATVSRFNADGSSAGLPLTGGLPTGRSGLAFAPDGRLLAGSFLEGAVLRYNTESESFEDFISPDDMSLLGASNLLVHDGALYVTALFTGLVFKFDALTGAPDPGFTPIGGLAFPAPLALDPGGNGILVGVLGIDDGTGSILRYGFDGTPLGQFAANSSENPDLGFREATGLLLSSFTPSPQVGDTDDDGDVDLDDLNAVRNNFDATGEADGSLDGDAVPFDGVVDLNDLNGVRNFFGGDAVPVPEPQTCVLAAGGLAALAALRRRNRCGTSA